MNIAMAFHAGDKEQVVRWLAWVEELGWNPKHKLFMMPARGQASDFRTGIPFTVVSDDWGINSNWSGEGVVRDAGGANSMVRQFAWYFYMNRLGPWMFCEPDCIPLRASWLDELESEYLANRKSFMGALVHVDNGSVPDHSTGNMIFPQWAAERIKTLMLPVHAEIDGQRIELAFDVAAAGEILGPNFHDTKLIQHVFRGPRFHTPMDLVRIKPEACLFHTDKRGDIIRLLREKKNENTKAQKQQNATSSSVETTQAGEGIKDGVQTSIKRVHTYFRPCVDKEALAEQKRILAIWEKAWREQGWEPVILTEADARKHPKFEKYRAAFEALPTVSPRGYELACFLRWVGMAVLGEGGAFLVDYDVLCNGGITTVTQPGRFPLILSDNNPVPCAVVGTKEQYQNAIDAFLICPIGTEQGKPHLSDMLAVQTLKFPAVDVCREYGTPDYFKAKLIHFSHRGCGKQRSEAMANWMKNGSLAEWQENPAWHMASHNSDLTPREITPADCIKALVAFSKKDAFAKGRIVKQLRKAGLIPAKK